MPIRVPSLDDRSFNGLVDELLARIPAHTPEWTNPTPGDPGHTLVELFAWLTDTLLYRVNLTPERQRLAFLRLLGVQMRAARPARTLLSLNFGKPENTLAEFLPELTRIKGAAIFETRNEVTVLPIVAESYYKRPPTDAERVELSQKIAKLSQLYPVTGSAVPYLTTPVFPSGKADPDGFDLVSESVDQALWFALLVPTDKSDDFGAVRDAVRDTLSKGPAGGPQHLNLAFSPKLTLPQFDENVGVRTPVSFVVELTTPDPSDPKGVAYLPLTTVSDTTSGLTRDGIIRLSLPSGSKDSFYAPFNNVRDDINAGTGDKPPRIDDPIKAARLVAWIRLRPKINLDSLSIAWTGINGVEVDQRQTTANLIVGQGSGQPDQVLTLPNGGIEEESFQLDVEEAGLGFRSWKSIADLALAGVQEPAYRLDAEAGTVRFGDGVRGKIPARGARFRATVMRIGGGDAGNLSAGSLIEVQTSSAIQKIKAFQPFAALGGRNAETLAEAEKRIPALFRNRDRAVTEDDYRQIAATTPGVSVGRVEVMPRFKPQERRSNVPGVVTVMALPYRPGFEAPYPNVDRPFIETVYKYLADRKPLGTELYVIGCEYVRIALTVGIDNPGGREETYTAVKEALQEFLFSLAPGGPQGDGWPLGRTVRRRELEIIVSRVANVDGVYGPNLFTQVNGAWKQLTTNDANDSVEIPLKPWQLPELVGVIVTEGIAPTEFKTPAPTKASDGLAIPVVKEIC